MCAGNPSPPKGLVPSVLSQKMLQQVSLTNMVDQTAMKQAIKSVVQGFLPNVCHKHVYKFDIQHTYSPNDTSHRVYAKWTFFNDIDVRLKFVSVRPLDKPTQLAELRSALKPQVDDFEEWQANAIMKCEAGEDIWERPTPEAATVSGLAQAAANQAMSAQAAQAAQGGLVNQLQSLQQQQNALSNHQLDSLRYTLQGMGISPFLKRS